MHRTFVAALALLASTAASATGLPPYSAIPSLQGDALVNFANTSLSHHGHKTVFYVGNSTVWNATSYSAEFCNYLNNPNVLSSLGLTPCTTSVSGYQALDSSGDIQVTFTGAAPSGYALGDIVLSQPTAPSLNTLIGAGVITSIGSNTINYKLVSPNPFPSSGSFVSSGGYITNSFANLGYNGASSSAILSTVVPTLATYVNPGDLVLVRGPLINDVRLGSCNLACATANVQSLYDAIAGAVPVKADIAWKTENSLLTTDPTSSGYVSPLSSSQAYSRILHDAVFQAFAALPPRAVVWDDMQIVYTKIGFEYASSGWMTDILHPNTTGQAREAEADAQILAQIISGATINVAALSNPLANTATNGVPLDGGSSWLSALRNQVGFSEFMTEHAMSDDYTAPWSLYPDSVLDPDRYDIVAYGQVNSAGPNYLRFTWPTVPSVPTTNILPGDLIWLMGSGVIQYPAGSSVYSYNSGGTDYISALGLAASIVPSSAYPGQPVVVARQHSYFITDVPKYKDAATWTYRHRIEIPASGTNFLRIQFLDSSVSWPNAITTADYLELPCGEIPLSGATIFNVSNYTQVNLTGAWTSCQSEIGWVFGTHQMEAPASVSVPQSLDVGQAVLSLVTGEIGLGKIAASGVAPGPAGIKLETVCGTNSGTAKIIVYGGTSSTPATLLDNIGAGVTGC